MFALLRDVFETKATAASFTKAGLDHRPEVEVPRRETLVFNSVRDLIAFALGEAEVPSPPKARGGDEHPGQQTLEPAGAEA